MSDLFISHSWKDKPTAFRIEADLGRHGLAVWVDHAELRGGEVLIDELQKAIEASPRLALLWSEDASRSRWVKTEWQAAFLLEKTIVPCPLDGTDLPVFLRALLSCSFQTSYEKGLDELVAAVRGPAPADAPVRPPAAVPAPSSPAPSRPSPEVTMTALVEGIYEGQNQMLNELGRNRLAAARRIQGLVDSQISQALGAAGADPLVYNLAGYHKKNAYLLRHWKELQAGSHPDDPLLAEAEAFFHQSLDIRPDELSAYNGLGSVFMLRGDLDAAEFFVGRALARSRAEGTSYPAAEQDMHMIRALKAARGSPPTGNPKGAARRPPRKR